MKMFAVVKKYGYGSTVLAMFRYRDDAINYIKEQMIESIPSDLLGLDKSEALEIKNGFYVQPLELELME